MPASSCCYGFQFETIIKKFWAEAFTDILLTQDISGDMFD